MTIKIGDHVAYVDAKNHTKLAIVTGTPETVDEDSSLDALKDGYLHLAVVAPGSSHLQPRMSVPSEVAVKELLAEAEQTLATYEAEHPESSESSESDSDDDDFDSYEDDDEESVDESADYKARAVISAHRSKKDGSPVRFWTGIVY